MVGAGSSAIPHSRLSRPTLSNYGNRIDCYAWGENIDTTATNLPGTKQCGGTTPDLEYVRRVGYRRWSCLDSARN